MINTNSSYKTMASKIKVIVFFICLFTFSLSFLGCDKEKKESRIVIWTNCPELALYAELFNTTNPNVDAVIVYKKNPEESLPPKKDELPPDIIIGNNLLSEKLHKNYKPLDYLFSHKILSSEMFYTELLNSGKNNSSQYLLPISFNLPAIIFANTNKSFVEDKYTISLEQLRTTSAKFNKKNKKGNFEKIGFTPLSNEDFLYLSTKLNEVNFKNENNKITWDDEKLTQTLNFFKDWASTENSSIQEELDFAIKYLFMPNYRQVSSERTLFAYTTSDELFKNMKNMDLNIDYRWLSNGKFIPIEDPITMLGLYKYSKKQAEATEFITWFFSSKTQDTLLSRKAEIMLNTSMFGIAGGLSSLIDVTEHILPIYYTDLLTNLPPASMLKAPELFPQKWETYKDIVIKPFIKEKILAEKEEDEPIFEDLEKDFQKKIFEN